jgi:hypothetical protein
MREVHQQETRGMAGGYTSVATKLVAVQLLTYPGPPDLPTPLASGYGYTVVVRYRKGYSRGRGGWLGPTDTPST